MNADVSEPAPSRTHRARKASWLWNEDVSDSGEPARSLVQHLQTPVDLLPLALFRIFFGAVMIWHVYSRISDLFVDFFYVQPEMHLTYWGFSWVRPWPGNGMQFHFLAMGLAAFGIMAGLFYRLSAAVFTLCFTYVFLLEKCLYLNHYYLICLIGFLLIFLPAHHLWSLDCLRHRPLRARTGPAWGLWLLRFQIAIPYFYGGLAKLNSDWLQGMPIRLWLERRADYPYIGSWFLHDSAVWFFAWGGTLFDLLVVPALLWRPTRTPAFLCALLFHLANSVLWTIGVFPWLMMAATFLLFYPAHTVGSLAGWSAPPTDSTNSPSPRGKRLTLIAGGVYVAWQLLFPFRHFLYPGNVSWTEEGHQFAWHMLLREKDTGLRFYVKDPTNGQTGLLKVSDFLKERQFSRMSKDPDMILDFVHQVRDHYRDHGRGDLEIRVLALTSLNGRKPQLLMDPTIDYASVERSWGARPWVIPLHEPLNMNGWNVPLADWDTVLADLIPNDMKQPVQPDPNAPSDAGSLSSDPEITP